MRAHTHTHALTHPTGSGFHLSDLDLSDKIRAASCASNEMTMYTSVFFLDSQTAGPVLQLSYSMGGELMSFPVFGLYLSADADEIQVVYRYVCAYAQLVNIFRTALQSNAVLVQVYILLLAMIEISTYIYIWLYIPIS